MTYSMELFENTPLLDKYLPINIFRKSFKKPLTGDHVCHLHWHEHLEIIIMLRGNATFYIDSEAFTAVSGDIFFVNSEQLHVAYSNNNHDVEYIAIVFNDSLLTTQLTDPWYAKYISPFLKGAYLFPTRIDRDVDHYPLFKKTILDIIKEFETKSTAYEFIVKSHLSMLIAYVFRFCRVEKSNQNIVQQHIELFKPLISFIQEKYADKITVEQAAKLVNMSSHHFCKTFKKITGRTFIDFVNMYRIEEAEKMLLQTDMSITYIAEKVGCCNANYFGKMYKKYRNRAPSEYRAEAIGE